MIGYAIVAILILAFLVYNEYIKSYWRKLGLDCPKFFPHIATIQFFYRERWMLVNEYYKKFKKDKMFIMYELFYPNIHICDLETIKDVSIRDFDHFAERRPFSTTGNKFSQMLSAGKGEEWKQMRNLMSPNFSSGRIKGMFGTVADKCDLLVQRIEEEMNNHGRVEIRRILGCFGMDTISAISFGLETGYLSKKKMDPIMVQASTMVAPTFKSLVFLFMCVMFPPIIWMTEMLPAGKPDYLENLVIEMVHQRRKTGATRGDFLDLLLELKDKYDAGQSKIDQEFSLNTIVSQAVNFILAGVDATSNGVFFGVYHLAKNPEKQKILRKELEEKLLGDFSYENIMACEYLDCAFSEAVRIHPIASLPVRHCMKDYNFRHKNLSIKKGTMVTLTFYSIHHDPEYWEDPEEYIPERFLEENKDKIVPFTFMPFGIGPRNCLASRFARLEAKIVLAKIFLNFEVKMSPGHDLEIMRHPILVRPTHRGPKIEVKRIVRA